MFVDSHCHLDFPELAAERESILALMRANQVTHALTISTTLATFPAVWIGSATAFARTSAPRAKPASRS
jgi:Tat protein secretion system quality control protein TatD with DNase activity